MMAPIHCHRPTIRAHPIIRPLTNTDPPPSPHTREHIKTHHQVITIARIKAGKYSFPSPYFDKVSEDAKGALTFRL